MGELCRFNSACFSFFYLPLSLYLSPLISMNEKLHTAAADEQFQMTSSVLKLDDHTQLLSHLMVICHAYLTPTTRTVTWQNSKGRDRENARFILLLLVLSSCSSNSQQLEEQKKKKKSGRRTSLDVRKKNDGVKNEGDQHSWRKTPVDKTETSSTHSFFLLSLHFCSFHFHFYFCSSLCLFLFPCSHPIYLKGILLTWKIFLDNKIFSLLWSHTLFWVTPSDSFIFHFFFLLHHHVLNYSSFFTSSSLLPALLIVLIFIRKRTKINAY